MKLQNIKKPKLIGTTLYCRCGHNFEAINLDLVLEEAMNKHSAYSEYEAEKVVCPYCNSSYYLGASIELEPNINAHTLECTGYNTVKSHDKYGKEIDLLDAIVGDYVDLEDGEYIAGAYEFEVENHLIQRIFNKNISEDQLSLAL